MFGPDSHGMYVAPDEFDRGEFDDCWRYELINGMLLVSNFPPCEVADMNDELGSCLRGYRDEQLSTLDATLTGRIVDVGDDRLLVDRAIWAGLGRLPRRSDLPQIIVDFAYKRNDNREHHWRCQHFRQSKTQEYWIIDHFERTMTIHILDEGKLPKKMLHARQTYRTKLLPGFELPLARLFALADQWDEAEQEDEA
jgi:Uma2 family endonuclease